MFKLGFYMKNGLLKSLGFSLLIGASALADSETNYVFRATGSEVKLVSPAGSLPRDCPPEFGWRGELVSYPARVAGKTAEIGVDARDPNGEDAGISEVILYQDRKRIASTRPVFESEKKWFFTRIPVTNNVAGTYSYQLEAIDNGGNRVKSGTLSLKFTGKPIDLLPEFAKGLYEFQIFNGNLEMLVTDEGDNKGLKEVRLYCDGKFIKNLDCNGEARFHKYLTPKEFIQNGKHSYFAEAIDKGGNSARSRTISIELK